MYRFTLTVLFPSAKIVLIVLMRKQSILYIDTAREGRTWLESVPGDLRYHSPSELPFSVNGRRKPVILQLERRLTVIQEAEPQPGWYRD